MNLSIIKEVNNVSAIVITDLTKRLGKQRVLSNINLEILDGEFFSLLGTENSGKTTLAKIIMGYLKPNNGSIRIYDMDSFKESKEIKESTSLVFEDLILNSNLKVHSLLKKTLNAHNLTSTEDIDALCDYFEFNGSNRISALDNREMKILSIINALVTKPRLLVLDNPTKDLNESDINKLFSHIKKLNETEGLTVLLLSDSLSEAKKYSSRIAYLSNGKIQNIEYNNQKISEDKVLKIPEYRGNLNYFTSIGARVIKDEDDETILYYDKEIPALSKVIYEENLVNYELKNAKLEDKINAYYSGDNPNPENFAKPVEQAEVVETSVADDTTIHAEEINGVTESTIKINEEPSAEFTEIEGVKVEDTNPQKDEIHNTKTNLFVDDEYRETVINNEAVVNNNDETIFIPSETNEDSIFNATENTLSKEDKDDI
ncbi:ATP-binding cassette domain-containing protein [Peptoniphilus ovalis]|uniref:ATP-binding cassette domain-containing protein n=1 Tax=Peptoniphilus ovalis TaxID=2841503 RepID=UPI001FE4985D|nr:ABC transporter ATP-binding protein [Peptoniphilus ovalis]